MALFHSQKGSVNYTIVGTPTIVDGILSDIGSGNSCTIPSYTSLEYNTVEMFFKVKRPSATSSSYIPFVGFGASNSSRRIVGNVSGGHIVRDADGIAVSISDNDFDFVTAAQSGYYLKLIITKNSESDFTYQLSLSLDKATWVSATGSYSSNICRGMLYLLQNSAGSASGIPEMDLNETYIKVNGQAWFGVCPVEVKHIDYGTSVGYVLTGNATVTDGVLGNLDSSSTAYISSNLPNDYNKIEMVFKLGYNATASTAGFLPICGFSSSVSQRRIVWIFSSSGSLVFKTSNSADPLSEVLNSSFNPVTYLNDNGFVFVKMLVEKINANYNVTVSASADGTNWINGQTGQTNTDPIGGRSIYLLRNVSGIASSRPLLFLGSSYIKVDDKLWFFRPATDYLTKDGKLVFADGGLYIEESGVKTYATKDIAPVPAGYTYGNTTTSAIGWVDMRTQAFTAASEGAILGKDEVSEES